ncbi:glycosyltransferase [Natrarchaeobius oligotrophus]|uniref:Glycosyltransferase n=1 Tax=Natrarchaeobius chitinivorans TaxID=1679083 RepID=A0A3N6M5B2_NATCH|nr:glycosyltransferase [Natrarchaeobius chitinivorans]RQG98758.1 glycosyltransferase [Natrarchaeobius chitinivorans]
MTRVENVTAFTDLYLPTINGVTYTIDLWRRRWSRHRDRMSIVYPSAPDHDPSDDEFPVRSVRAPLFPRYRLGVPKTPDGLATPDVVHVHTPFTVGYAGMRFARRHDLPVVASYHTVLQARADRVAPPPLVEGVKRVTRSYERWFFDDVDRVIVPTSYARRYFFETVRADADVRIVTNGIDTEFFHPVAADSFADRHALSDDRPTIGYTGRHGYEKNLEELLEAVDGMDVTVVLAGDGPARTDLEARAATADTDVCFLGFLDRDELPAFYSAIDVFAFPSPVETQGLVALEAAACGTPVVAVDAGALRDSVIEGETGYRYPEGDLEAFRTALRLAIAENDRLSNLCLGRRSMFSVEHAIDQLTSVYEEIV